MTLADFKRALETGSNWLVTNHYITRPDHPCHGTRRRFIVRNTSGGFWLSHDDLTQGKRIGWPKACNVRGEPDNVQIFGFPKPEDLFLTMRPATARERSGLLGFPWIGSRYCELWHW